MAVLAITFALALIILTVIVIGIMPMFAMSLKDDEEITEL